MLTNSLIQGENRMDKGGNSAVFSTQRWKLLQRYQKKHLWVKLVIVTSCCPKPKVSIPLTWWTTPPVLNSFKLGNKGHQRHVIENIYSTNSEYNITLTACNKSVLVRHTHTHKDLKMQTHLLLWKAICYDLTVYVPGYIYFLEDIHPQALERICYVMNLSSSSVI